MGQSGDHTMASALHRSEFADSLAWDYCCRPLDRIFLNVPGVGGMKGINNELCQVFARFILPMVRKYFRRELCPSLEVGLRDC